MATYGRLAYPADFPEILKIKLNPLLPGFLRVYEDFAQIPHFLSQIPNHPSNLNGVADGLRKSAYTPAGRWSLQYCLDEFQQLMVDLDKLVNSLQPNTSFATIPNTHEIFRYAREIVNLALQSPDPETMARDFASVLSFDSVSVPH